MIIDSHCHLDYPHLYNNLDEIIKRADAQQVKKFLTICTTLESFKKIKIIVNKYEKIFGTFGIHPHEAEKNKFVDSKYIVKIIRENNKIIGIGETGLDFYYNHSDRKIQIKSFIEHIHAASKLNLPIIVHSRKAELETLDILKNENSNFKLKILMHCFTGSKDFAKKLLDLNCYISISGIITFNNSKELSDTVTTIPIEKLLVETDSPYLSPQPLRGKPNEPSHIVHTVSKLSQIKDISRESVMEHTTNNFTKLFNL